MDRAARPAVTSEAGHNRGTPGAVTVGEAVAVAATALLAVFAIASLALAQAGHHDGRLALGISVGTIGIGTWLAWTRRTRPVVRLDRAELALLAGAIAVSSYFMLPGFTYAYVDKDPGIYAAHGFAIARDGDVDITDPVWASGLETPDFGGGRFPGIVVSSDDPTHVTSQFYHLVSATLASAHDLVGRRGITQMPPLIGIGCVVLMSLLARRVAGTLAAALAAGLLATNMIHVWSARTPGTEVLSQALLLGALLAAVLAITERWASAAFVSGALVTACFLNRPDGFLYVALAFAFLGGIVASGRFDLRAAAFGLGIMALLPYALWNAYDERVIYSRANSVPGERLLLAACVGAVATGAAVYAIRRRLGQPPRVSIATITQRRLGLAASVCLAVTFALLRARPTLLGDDWAVRASTNERFRTLDEKAVEWLSWFFSNPGLLVMLGGIAVLLVGRWRAPALVAVAPGLLLLPLYLWDPRITSRLMWWTRRFEPAAVPTIALLIAVGLAWGLGRERVVIKAASAILAAYLVIFAGSQSRSLRAHSEMAGSWELGRMLTDAGSSEESVFLFSRPDGTNYLVPNRNLPAALLLIHDRAVSVLPDRATIDDVERFQRGLPRRQILLVTPGDDLPPELPSRRFERLTTFSQPLAYWEESNQHRPKQALGLVFSLSVWELVPGARTGDG